MVSKNFNLNSTGSKNFYSAIIIYLKNSTNLINLQKSLSISKQQLNYYLRRLIEREIIEKKGTGWYEVVKGVKDSTKYDNYLVKDSTRGHAYIWEVKLRNIPKDWDKRIEVLTNKGINHKIVGAKLNTPRIKVLGRKVWLCNKVLRIFDKKDESYYGKTAKESRYLSLQQIKLIVGVLESKLGVLIEPSDISFKKEHYALIKNDLAIEENRKGNIIRISDDKGEWLIVDDSLEKGGELETIGKDAYKTNIPMQKWWNENKKTNFEVTPSFILNTMNDIQQVQKIELDNKGEYAHDLVEHKNAIKRMSFNTDANTKSIELLADVISNLKEEIKKINETRNT
jgi:hypothetical protein